MYSTPFPKAVEYPRNWGGINGVKLKCIREPAKRGTPHYLNTFGSKKLVKELLLLLRFFE